MVWSSLSPEANTNMNDDLFFLYEEHLEYTRKYLWFQGSKFSYFKGKESKVEAERYLYLSHYYFQKAVAKARQMMASK